MVDDGTGAGTFKIGSITITNPGVGYTGTPTITLSGGGAFTVANPTGWTLASAASVSGGLTKISTGVLTLGGNNTYTGPTTVSAARSLSPAVSVARHRSSSPTQPRPLLLDCRVAFRKP